MTAEIKETIDICHEIRMARMEKQMETIEAENYALRQKIAELEIQILASFRPLKEPIEVIGSWHTTKGASV